MNADKASQLRAEYRRCLLEDVVPFWQRFAVDWQEGGYFNCLARDGSLYSEDKSMLLTCRTIWLFSRLYNTIERREPWLAAAECGYRFLVRHLAAVHGQPALIVTRDGRPLERLFFSVEAYAVMACAEYATASGSLEALERARSLGNRLLALYEAQDGQHPDEVPRERRSKELVVPILLLGALRELRRASSDLRYNEGIAAAVGALRGPFLDPSVGMLREAVSLGGCVLPPPRGTVFIPGHSLHTSWALVDEGNHLGRQDLVETGLALLHGALDHGWDSTYGGFYQYAAYPASTQVQADWDMKAWWVHNEALYATLRAYITTRDERYLAWHDRVREYTFGAFPDRVFGEWFGYLHRDGTVALSSKGTMWKGVFHIASAMWQCLDALSGEE